MLVNQKELQNTYCKQEQFNLYQYNHIAFEFSISCLYVHVFPPLAKLHIYPFHRKRDYAETTSQKVKIQLTHKLKVHGVQFDHVTTKDMYFVINDYNFKIICKLGNKICRIEIFGK